MPPRSVQARAIRRIRWRLLPFLALLYFIAYLDRVNVGFAALQMNDALGFSSSVYGFGAGIFFLGYFLFEVPSNLALARIGARAGRCSAASRLGKTDRKTPWPFFFVRLRALRGFVVKAAAEIPPCRSAWS